MPSYRFGDATLSTDVDLPELNLERAGRWGTQCIRLEVSSTPMAEPIQGALANGPRLTDELGGPRVSRMNGGYLLLFPESAAFTVSGDGRKVIGWCPAGANGETFRHLLLDQVLPRVLAHSGRLVLHASAVRLDDRCVAFLADSGGGKSTLAARLHADGMALLADDGLVVRHDQKSVRVVPTYRSLRLWPDSVDSVFVERPATSAMAHYTSKRRVLLEPTCERDASPLPLAGLYVLRSLSGNEDALVNIARLSQRDACIAIIANAFQLDATDLQRAAHTLAQAADVAKIVPAFRLSFPRDFTRLSEVRPTLVRSLTT
jgi:hypothetical protein